MYCLHLQTVLCFSWIVLCSGFGLFVICPPKSLYLLFLYHLTEVCTRSSCCIIKLHKVAFFRKCFVFSYCGTVILLHTGAAFVSAAHRSTLWNICVHFIVLIHSSSLKLCVGLIYSGLLLEVQCFPHNIFVDVGMIQIWVLQPGIGWFLINALRRFVAVNVIFQSRWYLCMFMCVYVRIL